MKIKIVIEVETNIFHYLKGSGNSFLSLSIQENTKIKEWDIYVKAKRGGGNLYQAQDRLKSILVTYPHHQKDNEVLVHNFIQGL